MRRRTGGWECAAGSGEFVADRTDLARGHGLLLGETWIHGINITVQQCGPPSPGTLRC